MDCQASFSPPEELIVKKLLYYQAGGLEEHLRDISRMLTIFPDEIDLDRVGKFVAETILEAARAPGLQGLAPFHAKTRRSCLLLDRYATAAQGLRIGVVDIVGRAHRVVVDDRP